MKAAPSSCPTTIPTCAPSWAPPRRRRGDGFASLDADFIRVIEDVIDTLISKNVINITDLPLEAQTKLFGRKGYRERATKDALKLFGDDERRRSER